MNVLQLIIAIPLFTFMGFGISFILNMILKTTWVPLVLYAGLLAYFFITKGMLLGGDYLMLTMGLLGILSGGWTIRYLRVNGYRMF
ncbi:YuiB family protein [Marininema halotolerans]|uniref:Putative membrane protein n=1 Tax=Marininema halotolerans TaxID=1155944 RepID=A0A1I6PS88_9BACL|nr:YuiB family protein [Marininema halotolerans]SFS42948.1 Putative membrane protein [Marininema halotolerans]